MGSLLSSFFSNVMGQAIGTSTVQQSRTDVSDCLMKISAAAVEYVWVSSRSIGHLGGLFNLILSHLAGSERVPEGVITRVCALTMKICVAQTASLHACVTNFGSRQTLAAAGTIPQLLSTTLASTIMACALRLAERDAPAILPPALAALRHDACVDMRTSQSSCDTVQRPTTITSMPIETSRKNAAGAPPDPPPHAMTNAKLLRLPQCCMLLQLLR